MLVPTFCHPIGVHHTFALDLYLPPRFYFMLVFLSREDLRSGAGEAIRVRVGIRAANRVGVEQ